MDISGFVVRPSAEWIARAFLVATERSKNVKFPTVDTGEYGLDKKYGAPNTEEAGAIGEAAWGHHYGFPITKLDASAQDPGWDFCHGIWLERGSCDGITVEVKSSHIYHDSWVVHPTKKPVADWYVFADVDLENLTVWFRAKLTGKQVEAIKPQWLGKGDKPKILKRRVSLESAVELNEDDFTPYA